MGDAEATATGYTIKNLEEVEDSAVKFGLSPQMEAHFAREDLGGERSGVSLQRLQPNARQPFGHKHTKDEELYVVVSGGGRVKLDDDVHDLRTWDAVRVAPGVMRNFEAGPEGIAFLAFGSPASGTADTEVVQAWWTE